jgi:hypothetical protein
LQIASPSDDKKGKTMPVGSWKKTESWKKLANRFLGAKQRPRKPIIEDPHDEPQFRRKQGPTKRVPSK